MNSYASTTTAPYYIAQREARRNRKRSVLPSAEARLVFALATPQADLEELAAAVNDWGRVLQLASHENALIALSDGLRQLKHQTVPANVKRQLAVLSLDRESRMVRARERLEQLLVMLNRANIEVLLLKGSALATTVYGSFRDRPMGDVDILVRAEQVDEVRALTLSLDWAIDAEVPDDFSYGMHQHLPPLRDLTGTGVRLEIHRSILPARHPFRFNEDEIWKAACPVSVGAGQAFVMHPEHHAVHVAIHFAWLHMMRQGAWNAFRDLQALVRAGALDWKQVASMATHMGASSCCYWTLRLGHVLAGLSVPDAIMQELRPRLPELARRAITRHFVNGVERNDATCPSVRLDQALWGLAMQPDRHGHGDVRPWLVTVELLFAIRQMTGQGEARLGDLSFGKMRQCARYITAIVT
jgi:hypothetical protein